MLFWEDRPSAQVTDAQAVFLYAERCRLADNLVQSSAHQAAQLFAFRPAPASSDTEAQASAGSLAAANKRVASIVSEMASGLRLIYLSAPVRVRHLAARANRHDGLLPSRAAGGETPRETSARVRLILRQARSDTSLLSGVLAASGERFDAPEQRIAASTAIWRIGVAMATLLQSGRDTTPQTLPAREGRPEQTGSAASAVALARSVVRPGDWSSRPPLSLANLPVFSDELVQHLTGLLSVVVAEMREAGMADPAIRARLDRRKVPQWLIARVLRDNLSPWRKE